MSSQDTTLLLYSVMQIFSFSLFKHFPIKVNDVTIKIWLKSKNWAPQKGAAILNTLQPFSIFWKF